MNTSITLLSNLAVDATLLLCGGYFGLTLMCQIGVLPAMHRLSLKEYAAVWRILDGLMDKAMPPYKLSLLVVNLAAVIFLAVQHRFYFAGAASVSFLLSVAALVLTIRIQIPLNVQVLTLDADRDARALANILQQTTHNFAVRFYLAAVAFAVLCVGVVFFPML